jgi:hypothetical protein
VVSLNPFGTYHGEQLAYDHLGGSGVGTALTTLLSSALRPNGPSYNSERERFSLLIAPYVGDAPPERLRADAEAFFHPPAVVVRTAGGIALPRDLQTLVDARRDAVARQRTGPLPAPTAFLTNPSEGAVDAVWDHPRDRRLSGYELEWRRGAVEVWYRERLGRGDRHCVGGLENGEVYVFRLRAVGGGRRSEWTEPREVEVGPVEVVDPASAARDLPIGLLLRIFWHGLVHALTTW